MRVLLLLTLVAASLIAAAEALAVDQELKNGCSSPESYSGAITSPTFATGDGVSSPASVSFQAWFEIEAIDPAGHDVTAVEYGIPNASTGEVDWFPVDQLNPTSPEQGNQDQGYSNNGLATTPTFQPYSFTLPAGALSQPEVQVRFLFNSGDGAYQGFRGVGVDAITIATGGGDPDLVEGFETGASGWVFDARNPDTAGTPFWHIVDNPQNISVKNPEINPDLVTLPDAGFLPPAFGPTHVAWFGDDAIGTFCGPDYANRFVVQPEPPLPPPPPPPPPPRRTTLADLGTPDLGREANIDVVAGTVLVGIPSGAARASGRVRASQKGVTFVPLQEARQVPIGSFLDTRRGTVVVQSATGSGNRTQQGNFASGLFQVLQSRRRRARGLTDLVLKGGRLTGCGARRRPGRGRRSQAALTRRTIRRLRSNATGRFRTRGRYAAATVRGTVWTTTDRCDGTLTKVTRGRVAVRDFRRKRTVTLRAGKSYLAKAPG